ncbi:MAG: DUF4358 domain-containing protein [Cellulosilyticum sp.]|nr:DUF4358 domain-containing protein [Cellulosilyticum sp.]
MKKFAAIMMLLLASTTAFVGCTNNQAPNNNGSEQVVVVEKAPLNELLDEMIAQNLVRMPKPIDETLAEEAYHIDPNVVEEYAIAETGISPGPGLIVMVKAKEGKVEEAKANMEALLQDRIGNAFYPQELEAAENAEVVVDGNYVGLFILNDEVKDTAMKMFEESTK